MSEPLSSYQIEDVLSSIRRLVSEGKRPAASPAQDVRQDVAQMGGGRLLLTPALRIAAPQEVPAKAAPPIMMLVSSRPEPASLRATPDPEAPDLPDLAASNLAATDPATSAEDDESAEWSDVAWQAHIAEESGAMANASLVAAAPFRHASHGADGSEAMADPAPMGPMSVEPALVAQVEAQIVDALARGETLVAGPARLGLVDHALLQDMVRDLIRDELRGPLGARITRNLRKMIRAEINRAVSIRGND
jgi:hypothetical protein